jgi:hypothetical protein
VTLATGSVLVSLVGAASAQDGGLAGALDQQRQDPQQRQSDFEHEIEAQQRTLQRQEDRALQQGLRSSPGRVAPRESPVLPHAGSRARP